MVAILVTNSTFTPVADNATEPPATPNEVIVFIPPILILTPITSSTKATVLIANIVLLNSDLDPIFVLNYSIPAVLTVTTAAGAHLGACIYEPGTAVAINLATKTTKDGTVVILEGDITFSMIVSVQPLLIVSPFTPLASHPIGTSILCTAVFTTNPNTIFTST